MFLYRGDFRTGNASKRVDSRWHQDDSFALSIEVHHVDPGVRGNTWRAKILRPANEGFKSRLEVAVEDRLCFCGFDFFGCNWPAFEPGGIARIGINETREVE